MTNLAQRILPSGIIVKRPWFWHPCGRIRASNGSVATGSPRRKEAGPEQNAENVLRAGRGRQGNQRLGSREGSARRILLSHNPPPPSRSSSCCLAPRPDGMKKFESHKALGGGGPQTGYTGNVPHSSRIMPRRAPQHQHGHLEPTGPPLRRTQRPALHYVLGWDRDDAARQDR
jgi:hypothetical protein